MRSPSSRRHRKQGRVLERDRRFSDSLLWRLQRKFFDSRGAKAWTEGIVPHYITSNSWIANAYAKVVLGWLRDCTGMARERASFPPLDLRHPVHIVELGCGSGRFGYLFFNRLLDLLSRSSLSHVPVRYVLTDFTESNLDALRGHPALQPWIAEGLLDFACYDAEEDVEIRLTGCGEVLTPQTLRNPLVVIANYVFDSIPQDAFTVRDGRLFELRVSLTSPEEVPDREDPALLGSLKTTWKERPARAGLYGDPELDAVLAEYAERFEAASFLFPCAALRCLRNLARLADDHLLLLSGDKGYCHEEMLASHKEPELTVHGSFSLMVNYHALGRWFAHRGGEMLCTTPPHSNLCVVAGLLGRTPAGTAETRLAFDDAIDRTGPDDFYHLKKAMEKHTGELTLEQLLAWLRLSGWDANVLLGCFPALVARAGEASDLLRKNVQRAIHEVWRTHFPLPEARDLAFHLGVLLCEIQGYEDALAFFQESIASHGPNPATSFNVGLCLFHLGQIDEALAHVEESLAGAPDFEPALSLRGEIAAVVAKAEKRRPRRQKKVILARP